MSFDIFLYCFRNGEPATFERSVVAEIFSPHAYGDPDFTNVTFPDGSGACIYVARDHDIQGLGFDRCGGDAFFDALYRLADITKSVVFWPGRRPSCAVTDGATLAHLPDGFSADGCGPAQVVHSGAELSRLHFSST